MNPTKHAVDYVNNLIKEGHQVIFTTNRTHKDNKPEHLNLHETKAALATLNVKYTDIIEGLSSPRVVINDEGAVAVNHERNSPFILNANSDATLERVTNSLNAILWVNWKYSLTTNALDCDDYIQTILIARSLIANKGFNHRDLVNRYRLPASSSDGTALGPAGVPVEKVRRGQILKLVMDNNPLYVAEDGVTSGSAMKVCAVAAYYIDDFEKLVKATDLITKITHASIDARLAAILTALRYRQVFLNAGDDSPGGLKRDLCKAVDTLEIGNESAFFLNVVERAVKITSAEKCSEGVLIDLIKEIGLCNLAWCVPVTSCFWSYRADNNFNDWFKNATAQGQGQGRGIYIKENEYGGSSLKRSVYKEYENHIKNINYNLPLYIIRDMDIDTFLSISFGLIAAKKGLGCIENDLDEALEFFGDDISSIAEDLVMGGNSGV